MTVDGEHRLDYGPEHKLVATEHVATQQLREVFVYDGFGRMVAVHDVAAADVTYFDYDGVQKISATDSVGNLRWEVVWGGQDQLIEWTDVEGTGDRYVPLVDHRNSVVATWNASTGALDAIAEYNAEGRLTLRNDLEAEVCTEVGTPAMVCSNPSGIPFGFNSMWRSPTTGLVYMRNRWYSPRLAQFTTHDPLGAVDSTNLYAFAAFDPINGWDPWGLSASGHVEQQDHQNRPARTQVNTLRDEADNAEKNRRAWTDWRRFQMELGDVGGVPVGNGSRTGNAGEYSSDKKMIEVDPSLSPRERDFTLQHEMFHALEDFIAMRRHPMGSRFFDSLFAAVQGRRAFESRGLESERQAEVFAHVEDRLRRQPSLDRSKIYKQINASLKLTQAQLREYTSRFRLKFFVLQADGAVGAQLPTLKHVAPIVHQAAVGALSISLAESESWSVFDSLPSEE